MIVCMSPVVVRGQDALSQLREDVRTPSPSTANSSSEASSKPRRRSCGHRYACDCNDGESFFGALVGAALKPVIVGGFVGATSPFWGPSKLVDDRWRSVGYFAAHPYRDGMDGYMMMSPHFTTDPFAWSLQARSEYSSDFDDLTRVGNRLVFDTRTRFGADAEFNYWHEQPAGQPHDSLWTGDANLLFRIAQSERMQVRTGVGVNWLADKDAADFGFNFTYQGEFFPRDPWVLSGEIDWGTLGDETLFHARATVGVQWHRAEFFTGYDYFDVDRTELGTVVGGVRLWF